MKALILNSGKGSRMGDLCSQRPKCMTNISSSETILSRQLRQLAEVGVTDIVITTGAHASALRQYVNELSLPLRVEFVHNEKYAETNYIYSMYKAGTNMDSDLIIMHGDLVLENAVLDKLMHRQGSSMVVSSQVPLPDKDFKAVIKDGNIIAVGVEFFNDAVAAQPLYKLTQEDWKIWRHAIEKFCNQGNVTCYGEAALNEVSDKMRLKPLDVGNLLCGEVDTPADLLLMTAKLREIENRLVYMSFSTDVLHSGHIKMIKKAARLGRLVIGVLTDEAVASYKRMPLVPFAERKTLFANLQGVYKVVAQEELSYKKILAELQPYYVVHGDDWRQGFQKPVRDEVVSCLAEYGGVLVEFPYSHDEKYKQLDGRTREAMAMPDRRRGRLSRAIRLKGLITAIEAHSGLTGLLAEHTVIYEEGRAQQFDAMWLSSLCDSTDRGKPDIELVDITARLRTLDDIMEVTTKPVIFDADTGGLKEHFVYTVRTLERMGVSMVIIEDKTGLKKNSLFGTEVKQTQETIENFAEKIAAGKKAQKTTDFMICARIESLILECGMEDALKRAHAFIKAGADAIMIHSRRQEPDEVFEFAEKFRATDKCTPLVVVPTSYNQVTESEFKARGINVVIYANHLMRAGFPAMQKAAETILRNHRSLECDEICMPFKQIIRLIPAE